VTPLLVDVVSDIVCPWCYVGVKSFLAARDALRSDFDVTTRFRPYQLNPDLPESGVDRHAYYAHKFPDKVRLAAAREAIRADAMLAGFDFDPAAPQHLPNTLKAHQLIAAAQEFNLQEEAALALYGAFWDGLLDIGDARTLVAIGEMIGMARENVLAALSTTGPEVAAEADAFRRAGVAGVPTFIVGERTGFSGGMAPSSMIAALKEAARRNEGTIP
jgi:predicted DsbA family dithiol-disulfide isomerase